MILIGPADFSFRAAFHKPYSIYYILSKCVFVFFFTAQRISHRFVFEIVFLWRVIQIQFVALRRDERAAVLKSKESIEAARLCICPTEHAC